MQADGTGKELATPPLDGTVLPGVTRLSRYVTSPEAQQSSHSKSSGTHSKKFMCAGLRCSTFLSLLYLQMG